MVLTNMPRTLPKLIIILGPTASGKTKLAIELAREFNGEIVSADSRQVYREMDIGTSKVKGSREPHGTTKKIVILNEAKRSEESQTKLLDSSPLDKLEAQNDIKIHMVDIVNPDEEFTLAQYKEMALKIIKDIQKRGKLPFLVGGTGLYIQAIVDNLQIPKIAPNKALREKLEMLNLLKLLEMLKKIDPRAAEVIDTKNKRRLIRAIEVSLSGKIFSSVKTKGEPLFDCIQIGIKIPKEKLDEKINKRVDEMIETGLVEEIKKLKEKYSCATPKASARFAEASARRACDIPSMSGIGYKEICQALESGDSNHGTAQNSARNNAEKLDKAIELIKRNTRRYSRRQMTWFRRDKRIHWIKFYPEQNRKTGKETEKLIKEFLKNKNKRQI